MAIRLRLAIFKRYILDRVARIIHIATIAYLKRMAASVSKESRLALLTRGPFPALYSLAINNNTPTNRQPCGREGEGVK